MIHDLVSSKVTADLSPVENLINTVLVKMSFETLSIQKPYVVIQAMQKPDCQKNLQQP